MNQFALALASLSMLLFAPPFTPATRQRPQTDMIARQCFTREFIMNSRLMALFLATILPGLVFAQGSETYQCSYGELQRRVEILHETEMSVPCEVHYYKDTEAPGERQVLWSATNDAGYCEKKAEEFISRLQGWGWDCGQGDAQESMPAVTDDSASLTTAEETEPSDDE